MRFNSPLGLVLAGGGAHGAWQAGCLQAFAEAGLAFNSILGVSIGSISGVAYVLDKLDGVIGFWRGIDSLRIMRFAPRLGPLSLFSNAPLWQALDYIKDDEASKKRARCAFTVVTLCRDDGRYHYARFSPGGRDGWDGPLVARLVASCSVPLIFPPVRIAVDGVERAFVDGGARHREWVSFGAMAGCRDVLMLQMLRPEEVGGFQPLKRLRGDQLGRDLVNAVEGLKRLPDPPRVFRLHPSVRLAYSQFSFRASECSAAIELGLKDAREFLGRPERFIV